MSEMRLNSVRERIVESHSDDLEYESLKGGLLALAVVLATFGSAAVLMPEGVTGDFASQLSDSDIQNFVLEDLDVRDVRVNDGEMDFVQDFEIHNPNIVPAEFQAMSYRAEIGSDVVGDGAVKASKTVDSDQSEMIAVVNEASVDEYSGEQRITVEGKVVFEILGDEYDSNYRHSFIADTG